MNRGTVRDSVVKALKKKPYTAKELIDSLKFDEKKVSTVLSSLVLRSKIADRYKNDAGKFVYYLLEDKNPKLITRSYTFIDAKDITLKLAQLRTHKQVLKLNGLSLVDNIIDDYEKYLNSLGK